MKLFFCNLFKVLGIFLIIWTNSFGQIDEIDSIHKVEFKPFSPPVKEVIDNLLFTQAQVFMAPDITGKSHNLLNYRGKTVLLWFWKMDNQVSKNGLNVLSEIKNIYGDKLEIFAFANDKKKELLEYFKDKDINYNIMFNSGVFAEMMYGGNLGFPRLFLINPDGYIVKILSQEYLEKSTDLQKDIYKIIDELKY